MAFKVCCSCNKPEPICLRAFDSTNGALTWELQNFCASGRSPDNTLWGWSVRRLSGLGFTRRQLYQFPIASNGTMPSSGTGWPQKTNPSDWGLNIVTNAIDLVKVAADGTKTTTVSDWLIYSNTKSSSPNSIWSRIPYPSSADEPTVNRLLCTNAGRYIPGTISNPPEMFLSNASILVEDGAITADDLNFTIRAAPIRKHASAGINTPEWFFRRAGTNVSCPLYATATELQTALASLPGVTAVVCIGGPLCLADMNVSVSWSNPAFTLSDAWVSWSSMPLTQNVMMDMATGTPAGIMTFSPFSFTSDGASVLRTFAQGARRVALTTTTEHPWLAPGSTEWTTDPFTVMSQTNERVKLTFSGGWDVVPKITTIADVRNGSVLLSQTRSRVPVTEPSSAAFTTHAVVNETSGAVISTTDCFLNQPTTSLITDSGEIAVLGEEYRYPYQGWEGIAPPTGYNSGSATGVPSRSRNGRHFTTGSSDLFEPFSLQAPIVSAVNDDSVFSVGATQELSNFDWNFSVQGTRSTLEMRLSGDYLCGQWQNFPAGVPIPAVPAHQREYWFCFSKWDSPTVPTDCEFRFLHKTGGTTHKQTAWLSFSATVADLDDELQLWYGEPIAGYPTITISGTIEDHEWQTQPVWQYLPLASIDIWNDATGSVFAPRGRVLALEVRNGTPFQTRSLVAASRSDGVIQWQKDVGFLDRRYPTGTSATTYATGQIQYVTDSQVVVSTLCKPELDDTAI